MKTDANDDVNGLSRANLVDPAAAATYFKHGQTYLHVCFQQQTRELPQMPQAGCPVTLGPAEMLSLNAYMNILSFPCILHSSLKIPRLSRTMEARQLTSHQGCLA